MKKTLASLILVGFIGGTSLMCPRLSAQELMAEQVVAENAPTVVISQVKLTSAQIAKIKKSLPTWKIPPPPLPPLPGTAPTLSKNALTVNAEMAASSVMTANANNAQPQGVIQTGCSPNWYTTVGVPQTTTSYWITSDNPLAKEYPWQSLAPLINNVQGALGDGAESFPAGSYPPYISASSSLALQLGNDFNQFGVAMGHVLCFWYAYIPNYQGGDTFDVVVGHVAGPGGTLNTNMPKSLNWTRAIIYVPPYSPVTSNPFLIFTGYKGATQFGPDIYIGFIQWCVVDLSHGDDLQITRVGNSIKVQWNTYVFPPDKFVLSFAGTVNGIYSTNIGTTVVTSNHIASASFVATNSMRYYRLKPL